MGAWLEDQKANQLFVVFWQRQINN